MELNLDIRSYQHNKATHIHDFHQLILPLAGSMEMEIYKNSESVSPQQAAIIPANTEHGFSAKESSLFIVADVAVTLFQAIVDEINQF